MVESPYQKIAAGEMKGWIRRELFPLLPPHFFRHPIGSAIELGGNCVRESKWRWVGFFDLHQGRRIFLKRDLTKDWMEALKYMILPSKGRKEWFIAYQLGKRNFNIPKPLGWLERNHKGFLRESYYLSEAIESRGSLADSTEILKDERISMELVKMMIRIHRFGLFHQDLHAGNFLWNGESFFLIDLHRARLIRSLSLRQRLWNMAQLFHSLRTVWDKADYEKFLLQYFEGDSISMEKKKGYLQQVYFDMDRLQKRQWQSRTKRCLKESTEFSVKKEKGFAFYHRRDFPLDRLKRIVEKHLTLVHQTPSLLVKQSPQVRVSILEDEGKGSKICVKQFCYPLWWDRIRERFRHSKGRKAWIGGNGLKVRGIPTVQPLGLMERRNFFGHLESFFIMETLPEAQELDRYLFDGFKTFEEKKRFIKACANWLFHLHEKNLYHQDMKACNVLVQENGGQLKFYLLDLEDVLLDIHVDEKRLLKNLIQLNTSIPETVTKTDRLRFFREYRNLRPVVEKRKPFLRALLKASRKRGVVYVSPTGVAMEKKC